MRGETTGAKGFAVPRARCDELRTVVSGGQIQQTGGVVSQGCLAQYHSVQFSLVFSRFLGGSAPHRLVGALPMARLGWIRESADFRLEADDSAITGQQFAGNFPGRTSEQASFFRMVMVTSRSDLAAQAPGVGLWAGIKEFLPP